MTVSFRFTRVNTLCKRNKKLSWTRSINSSRTSTKQKKRVLSRKLTLEIYNRFGFALLFAPPLFFFFFFFVVFNRSFVRSFVCSLVSTFVCRSFFCFCSLSLFISSFTLLSFVSSRSPVPGSDWKMKLKSNACLRCRSQLSSDRLVMRQMLKWWDSYSSSLFFHLSGT